MSDFKAYVERLKAEADLGDVVTATAGFTLVRKGRYFTTKEHDSLSIDVERGWFEWYSKAGGVEALHDVALDVLRTYQGATARRVTATKRGRVLTTEEWTAALAGGIDDMEYQVSYCDCGAELAPDGCCVMCGGRDG